VGGVKQRESEQNAPAAGGCWGGRDEHVRNVLTGHLVQTVNRTGWGGVGGGCGGGGVGGFEASDTRYPDQRS